MVKVQRRWAPVGIGMAAGLLMVGVGLTPAMAVDPEDLEDRVTVAGVRAHLDALQAIATANGGNRAAGTTGYEASGQYIEQVLIAAGYEPVRHDFEATTQSIDDYSLAIDGITFTDDEDGDGAPGPLGLPMEFTPSTPVAGLTDVPLIAPAVATGCDDSEWGDVDATGQIAIVSRGVCAFSEKSAAAGRAGALAVIVYNTEAVPLAGTLGEQTPDLIPSVGILPSQGQTILAAMALGPVTADLQLQQTVSVIQTFNITADTPTGNPENTVMLGAHLDSVLEGPGINDNGSGSAAILETAVQLAASGPLTNRVRFAWWGAEELGLFGSADYVARLSDEEAADIVTYLNFDMIGSPNYVISVYDADESTYEAPVEVPAGSIETEDALTDYFDEIGQPWIDTAFDGRSDYDAFISAGIAASGLFTGADDVKTADEAALFGGTVGEAHDQNYHSAGDDIDNINDTALGIMIGAIAHVTAEFANDVSGIPGAVLAPVPPTPTPTPTPILAIADPELLAESGGEAETAWGAGAALLLGLGVLTLVAARRRTRIS
ncbi:M28 family peptidase [Microbacterium sp. P05]|uniref:M28 family peptidase n=1 Tax=Microbacterium sp. P05 TaxID=3366948 RepID=UPI003745B626